MDKVISVILECFQYPLTNKCLSIGDLLINIAALVGLYKKLTQS